jgi:hypothetical protein
MYYHHNPGHLASPAQRRCLEELGIRVPNGLSSYDADRLIKANYDRWAAMPPTRKQAAFLRLRGRWEGGMTRGEAAELIARLTGNRDWPLGPGHPSP